MKMLLLKDTAARIMKVGILNEMLDVIDFFIMGVSNYDAANMLVKVSRYRLAKHLCWVFAASCNENSIEW